MEKNLQEFTDLISATVNQYLDDEECYNDNVQLQINPATGEVELTDSDEELDGYDYIPAMDLVKMSTEELGQWETDAEAIAELAAQYFAE